MFSGLQGFAVIKLLSNSNQTERFKKKNCRVLDKIEITKKFI